MFNKLNILVAICIIIIAIGVWFIFSVSIKNRQIELRSMTENQNQVCMTNFDKMFKIINQLAQVSEENITKSKEAFKEIYIPLMEGRYGNKQSGALMSWVQESNPNFDLNATSDLFKKLANAIEENRTDFFIEQKKLIDYQREHKTFIRKWPGSMFFDYNDTCKIQIITSSNTQNVYKTGDENELNLFQDKK